MRNNVMDNFHKALVAACSVIGISEDDIILNGTSLLIPSENISISPALSGVSNKDRVWRVTTKFVISSIDGVNERETNLIIFEENFSSFFMVSKKVALYLAEKYIDNAIEKN